MNHKTKVALAYGAVAAVALVAWQAVRTSPHTQTITYTELGRLIAAGKVNRLEIGDERIQGSIDPRGLEGLLAPERVAAMHGAGGRAHRFVTARVEDPGLVPRLTARGIDFGGQLQNPWLALLTYWILPGAAIALVGRVIVRRVGEKARSGPMALGKSKARVHLELSTGATFADVAGIDEARVQLEQIVDLLKRPRVYERIGGFMPKGVLLTGPPGCGKTLLARAVAGEAGVPFLSLSGAEFAELFVGVGAARVRDLFDRAEALAPSVIFIDEIDALGRMRPDLPSATLGLDDREQTLDQLLSEMDGFEPRKGVLLLGATNRPEVLDPALLRAGRFDRKVAIGYPDVKGRLAILEVHANRVCLAPDVDLGGVAAATPGLVGADLASIVNEAALLAVRRGRSQVGNSELEEAAEVAISGPERRSCVLGPREKRIVAYHEAGHALVAERRALADPVERVTIVPHGDSALGFTRQIASEERHLYTRQELLDRLDVLLGGRVAEELAFGDISSGASDDLARATSIARNMVTLLGMSERIGLLSFRGGAEPICYSDETGRLIDAEVRELLEQAHQRVRSDLAAEREALDRIALELEACENLDRPHLEALLAVRAVASQGKATVQRLDHVPVSDPGGAP